MTPIADMIEEMTTRGVPLEVILLAVRTAELSGKSGGIPVDMTAEKRRAYDRERKRNKTNSTGKSTGIPPEHGNALSSLEHTQENSKGKKKEEAKRPRGYALPDDWRPSESHYADGEAMHRSRSHVDAKADEMRLWARANGHRAVARKTDWDATFTGWMRRDWGNMNGAKNGHANHGSSVSDAFDRLIARSEGRGGTDCDQPSGDSDLFVEGR